MTTLERVGRAPQVHPQAELQRHRLRELRRPPEPSPARVERRAQPLERGAQDLVGERLRRRPEPRRPLDRLGHLRALGLGFVATVLPDVRDRRQHLPERREAVAVLVREVGAGEEGPAVGRQERGQRPAAAAGHRLDGVHVDRVQVGALLAVDLDRDEALVHQGRRLRVLERLPLHHVAPVAGRVPDREQDRLVLRAGALERLLAPGEPVHGVRGVLEQVRARLVLEAVHGRGPRVSGSRSPQAGQSTQEV